MLALEGGHGEKNCSTRKFFIWHPQGVRKRGMKKVHRKQNKTIRHGDEKYEQDMKGAAEDSNGIMACQELA